MKNSFKRVLSLVLAMCMIFSNMPVVFAEGIEEHGHIWIGSTTAEASCAAEGEMQYVCDCGSSYTEVIPSTGHSYSASTTEATCTEMGETVYTCDTCGDTYSEKSDATGHSFADGACTVCGEADPEYVAPHEHAYAEEATTAAACAAEGVKTFTCECGEAYTEAIDALGHSYADGLCTVCGAADPEYVVEEEETAAVMIGEEGFDSLYDAVSAAEEGDTVVLMENVVLTSSNEAVAAVRGVSVEAIAPGTCTITAVYEKNGIRRESSLPILVK